MKLFALAFTVMVMLSAPAQAKDAPWLLTGFVAAQTLDGTTTYLALHSGRFHEANPLFPQRLPILLSIKATTATMQVLVAHKVAPGHPRLAKVIYIAGIAGSGFAGLHNAKLLAAK